MTSPAPPRPVSDHFDGTRFFNPGVDTDKSLADLWRWSRTATRAPWPTRVLDEPGPAPPAAARPGEIAFTFVGQATVLIQVAGTNILTDPMFSSRASPWSFMGPKRVRPPGIAFDDLPRVHFVLLSHNHYDHLDLSSLRRLRDRWAPRIVTGLGNEAYLARHGIDGAVALDWWDELDIGPGMKVSFVPAQHWSSRSLFDRRRMLWGGFVIGTRAGTVYFAGDTGYTAAFSDIAERYRPDVALLPIGAYEPRWFMELQHMNPEEAVRAHLDLGVKLSLGLHWGTFRLTDEAIDAPVLALEAAKRERALEAGAFLAPAFGRTLCWPAEAAGR